MAGYTYEVKPVKNPKILINWKIKPFIFIRGQTGLLLPGWVLAAVSLWLPVFFPDSVDPEIFWPLAGILIVTLSLLGFISVFRAPGRFENPKNWKRSEVAKCKAISENRSLTGMGRIAWTAPD